MNIRCLQILAKLETFNLIKSRELKKENSYYFWSEEILKDIELKNIETWFKLFSKREANALILKNELKIFSYFVNWKKKSKNIVNFNQR